MFSCGSPARACGQNQRKRAGKGDIIAAAAGEMWGEGGEVVVVVLAGDPGIAHGIPACCSLCLEGFA